MRKLIALHDETMAALTQLGRDLKDALCKSAGVKKKKS
jgi:hypothetical protein